MSTRMVEKRAWTHPVAPPLAGARGDPGGPKSPPKSEDSDRLTPLTWCLVASAPLTLIILGAYAMLGDGPEPSGPPVAASARESSLPPVISADHKPPSADEATSTSVSFVPGQVDAADTPGAADAESPESGLEEGSTQRTAPSNDGRQEVQNTLPSEARPEVPETRASNVAVLAQETAVEVQAFAGEPFGVGKITVDFPEDERPIWPPDQSVFLDADQALYPAFHVSYAARDDETRWQVSRFDCYFLFTQRESFEIQLKARSTHAATVVPVDDADEHRSLLNAWWRQYKRPQHLFSSRYAPPGITQDYLTSMLARRLDLSPRVVPTSTTSSALYRVLIEPILRSLVPGRPQRSPRTSGSANASSSYVKSRMQGSLVFDFDSFLGLLFGTESIRKAIETEKMLTDADRSEAADRPLPNAVNLRPVRTAGSFSAARVEPIAYHVPQECFYLRCGSLKEYLWLRNLVVGWGGSFNDLISTKTVDRQIRPRLERQLALSPDADLQRNLDRLVTDVALIGSDVLFRDGAALGVLFEARDGRALEQLIRRQRRNVREVCPEAIEQEGLLGPGRVSFLSTPDNRVRSFYAIDGKYHLVTTSSHVARRFLETGKGNGALGRLHEFQHARSVMPVAREDAIFIYLSDPFFRSIVGPHYRIEMTRRARALRDVRHVHLARLAARAEGIADDSIESLIEARLLPAEFLTRPDGSRAVLQDGVVSDSLRGAVGSFLPIPDVTVATATHTEVASYQRFAGEYQQQWRRMDPVAIGLRHASVADRDRVALDVRITPYARENYERLYVQLDPPDRLRLAPVPGDVMTVEARLKSFGSYVGSVRAQHPRAYAGLRDFVAPYTVQNGRVNTVPLSPLSLLGKDYRSYAGAMVAGDARSQITGDGHSPRDQVGGYSFVERRFPALLSWRKTWNQGWVAWAHEKEIVEETTPHLRLEQADRPAQVRFRLGDVLQSRLGPTIQAICYMHARRLSASNVRQIDQMAKQFKLDPEEGRLAAEELLGGKMVCPLGGEYYLAAGIDEHHAWKSSAWGGPSVYFEEEIPKDYRYPFLDWLRGAVMELSLDRTTLSTHVELEVKQAAAPSPEPILEMATTAVEPATAPLSPPSEPSDQQRIQGTWEVVDMKRQGVPLPDAVGATLRFQDDEIVQVHEGDQVHRYHFRLHPDQQPKGFDFRPQGRQIWSDSGIYRLEGDTLRICYVKRGAPRPADFSTRAEDMRSSVVLHRSR